MKKLIIILLGITVLGIVCFGQNKEISNKYGRFKGFTEKHVSLNKTKNQFDLHFKNERILKSTKEVQEIMPDSASTLYQYEGDTISGYINFLFNDTLHIEENYIKGSAEYRPFMKDEYHFDNSEKNTGYYISYDGNDEGGWTPNYKEEIISKNCEVAGFRNCIYNIGRTYEWNNERSDWRGSSGNSEKFDSLGRRIESGDYAWDEDLYNWFYINRTTWEYNNFGMSKLEVNNSWSAELNSYIPDSKDSSSYDEQGRILLKLVFKWNLKIEKWDTIQKRDYSYNENNLFQSFYEKDPETGYLKLNNCIWEESLYNDRNLLIRKNHYAGKNLVGPWGIPRYDLYEYNENDKLIKYLSEWFVSAHQTIYDYDANGHLILEAYYKKNSGEENWILTSEDKYNYAINGNFLEEQHYYWDALNLENSGWKETNEYDDFGNQLIKTGYNLNIKDSTYTYSWKYEKLRDNTGRITKIAEYRWDSDANKWIGQYGLTELFYQNELLKKTQYSEWNSETNKWNEPYYFEEFFYKRLNLKIDSVSILYSNVNNCSIEIYGFGGEGKYTFSIDNQSNWVSSSLFSNLQPGTYYIFIKDESGTIVEYINNPVVISATVTNNNYLLEANIFPNPFEDKIIIKMEQTIFNVSIFNPAGQLIYYQENIYSEHSIQFDENKKGIYLIYICTKNGCYNKKLIKI